MNGYLALGIILLIISLGMLYFLKIKSKHIKWVGPLSMYRTKSGLKLINRIANLSPRFWRIFSTIGVAVAFFLMANVFFSLLWNTSFILRTPDAAPGAVPIIPGVTTPFWAGIFAIIILLVFHEFSHGIIARAEKIRLKSVGALLFGFLPLGAFVEPDEKQIKKAKTLTQLRIFAAGSFMNILVAMIVLFIVVVAVLPAFTSPVDGAYILSVDEGGPADLAGITEGMVITEINGQAAGNIISFTETIQGLDIQVGDQIDLVAGGTSYSLIAADVGDGRNIGVTFCGKIPEKLFFQVPYVLRFVNPSCYPTNPGVNSGAFWFAYGICIWIVILNYGVALLNLLPLKPFDGGLMVESVSKKYAKKYYRQIVAVFTILSIFFLLINLVGPYLWRVLS